jgi:hypothetical protein
LKTYGAENEENEYEVSYEVRSIPGLEWKHKNLGVPIGYRIIKNARIRSIEAGKSILFSIPEENLADGLGVYLYFSYEWEFSELVVETYQFNIKPHSGQLIYRLKSRSQKRRVMRQSKRSCFKRDSF